MKKTEKPKKLIASRYLPLNKKIKFGLGNENKIICLDVKTNKKVFLKIGENYKSLESEYVIHNYFYKTLLKLKKDNVVTTKPLGLVKSNDGNLLISEYLNLKNILNIDTSLKAEIYTKTLYQLNILNSRKKLNVLNFNKRKSTLYILTTVPYFVAKAVLNGAGINLIAKSLGLIAKNSLQWLILKSSWICHGDINTTNIFLYKNKIVLLDFGEAVFSHKYYDMSKAINSSWYKPKFSITLLDKLIKTGLINRDELEIFKTFSTYNLLQRLSVKNSEDKRQFYINQLKKFTAYEN